MVKNDPATWPASMVDSFIAMWNAYKPMAEMIEAFKMGKDSICEAARKLQLSNRNKSHFEQIRPRKKRGEVSVHAAENIRPCLMCGRQFHSDGNHNRLCPSCITESRRSNTGYDEHRLAL